jgi:hypothetical protein
MKDRGESQTGKREMKRLTRKLRKLRGNSSEESLNRKIKT